LNSDFVYHYVVGEKVLEAMEGLLKLRYGHDWEMGSEEWCRMAQWMYDKNELGTNQAGFDQVDESTGQGLQGAVGIQNLETEVERNVQDRLSRDGEGGVE
jgi:hypothetical protein